MNVYMHMYGLNECIQDYIDEIMCEKEFFVIEKIN